MKRSELIQALASKLPDLQARDVELAVNCMIELIAEALASGERIEVRDFGSFSVRHRAARIARNPKTGESLTLPAKTVVHFKPGKQLKDRVDASHDQCSIK